MPVHFDDIPTFNDWIASSSSSAARTSSNKWTLEIDSLIQQYHQSMPMSRLNILMELKFYVQQWTAEKLDANAKFGGKRPEAMRALAAVVLQKLADMTRWGTHRYEEASCIAFVIPTGEFQTIAGEDRVKYRGYDSTDLAKRATDDLRDIDGRCRFLGTVIDEAQKKYEALVAASAVAAAQEKKRLKIFMVPEFFFRGAHGAYSIERLWLVAHLMRAHTQKPIFDDWLFILGTAVCFTAKENSSGVHQGVILENFALVQKGGVNHSDGLHDYFVEKEYTSHIDYNRPTGVGPEANWHLPSRQVEIHGKNEVVVPPEGSRDTGHTHIAKKPYERRSGCIFIMDGITVGLEVCLDHLKHRLKTAPDCYDVQLQLITSAGASIQSSAVVDHGLIFNVDGGSNAHGHLAVMVGGTPNWIIPHDCGPISAPIQFFPGDGRLWVFDPQPIPWPGPARADVANTLKVPAGKFDGAVP